MNTTKLRQLGTKKQKRLVALMARNNEGKLASAEKRELRALVRQTEEIMLDNARRLARRPHGVATGATFSLRYSRKSANSARTSPPKETSVPRKSPPP